MKKIVLTFGLMSGSILAVMTAVLIPLALTDTVKWDFLESQVVGYSAMLVAFLAVFFGIRRYRDDVGGGAITFGKAFKVGILIALIGCAMYVAGWEIAYWGFIPDFGEKYAAASIEKMRAKGASPAEIDAHAAQMKTFQEWYRNPFLNVAITFLEVFPISLIVTLISAAILRRKPGAGAPETAAA